MSSEIKPPLAFVTDNAPHASLTYRKAQDLFHAGHHPINPLLTANGIIEYERGAAAIGITPDGEMILVSTTDIDDLKLEHRFSKDGVIQSFDPEQMQFYKGPYTVDEDILHNGSKYLGQFIKYQPLKNGDDNYKHILGIAAWEPTPKQLVHSLLQQFSSFHRQDLLDSGILMRQSETLWTSKEIVFEAKPSGRKNEKDEDLYDLDIFMAPGKGRNAAQIYHRAFKAQPEKISQKISQVFKRAACWIVKEHQYGMTIHEIEAYAKDTFSKRAKLLRQGKSPFVYDIDTGKRKTGFARTRGALQAAFTSAAFGLATISRTDLLVSVAFPATVALGGLLTEHEGVSLAGLLIPTTILSSRFLLLLASKSRQNFEHVKFNNLVHHFWGDGIKERNIPMQFEMIHPKVIENLRIMPGRELNLFSRVPANRITEAPGWDKLYILGTQNGPYGSHACFHQIGEQWVIRTDEEDKSSGMNIEYWVQSDTAFARNPVSEHLPQRLIDDFAANQDKIRMVKAVRDEEGNITEYVSSYINQDEYQAEVAKMTGQPGREIYHVSRLERKFFSTYPLSEKVTQQEDETEMSEFSYETRAASLAEIAAEAAKAVARSLRL